jgi:hypothetical protein
MTKTDIRQTRPLVREGAPKKDKTVTLKEKNSGQKSQIGLDTRHTDWLTKSHNVNLTLTAVVMVSWGLDIGIGVITHESLDCVLNTQREPTSSFRRSCYRHRDFSFVRLATQGVTYVQRCFRQTIWFVVCTVNSEIKQSLCSGHEGVGSSGGTALTFFTKCRWVPLRTIPTEYEAGWAAEPVRILWRRG